jgi:hypothetical protein
MTVRAFLCPPLFFAGRREWGSFVINGALYAVSLLCITAGLVGIVARDARAPTAAIVAVFFWLPCFVHVADTLRRERAKARAAAEPPPRLRKTQRVIKVALFLVSFVAILLLLRSLYTATGRPVGPEIFPLFPVMVMTSESGGAKSQATIVFHKDLADFLQKNPSSSYLVPREDERRLKSGLGAGSFEVQHRADGAQVFKVWRPVHPEAFVIGWYEVSEKQLFPRRFLLFHEMTMSMLGIPALFGSLLLTWLAGKLLAAKLVLVLALSG